MITDHILASKIVPWSNKKYQVCFTEFNEGHLTSWLFVTCDNLSAPLPTRIVQDYKLPSTSYGISFVFSWYLAQSHTCINWSLGKAYHNPF